MYLNKSVTNVQPLVLRKCHYLKIRNNVRETIFNTSFFLQLSGVVCNLLSFSCPFIHYWLFQGCGSGVVSVSCFGVRDSVMFHNMFVHYYFSSVTVAEWPPFWK